MPDEALLKKLGIKPGHSRLVIQAPPGYSERVGPAETKAGGTFDCVLVFAKDKAAVDANAAAALKAVSPGGLLWFSYPKKSGAVKSDITRDHGWEALYKAGWRPVTQIAIDDTWSALRFRPAEDVKASSDRFDPAKRRA